jgi:tRNA(Met) cytidine acetyltransferase
MEVSMLNNWIRSIVYEVLGGLHRRLVVFAGSNREALAARLVLEYLRRKGYSVSLLYVADRFNENSTYQVFIDKLKSFEEVFEKLKIQKVLYEDSEEVLGSTHDLLILDLTEQLKPDDIGRLVEVVKGGGLVVFLTPRLEEWEKTVTRFHRRLIVSPYTERDLKYRFVKRFIQNLLTHEGVWVFDDGKLIRGKTLPKKVFIETKPLLPAKPKIPLELYRLAKTQDQVEVLQGFEKLTFKGARKSVLLITANRGRGKSAVLGLGAASILYMLGQRKKAKIRITAPNFSGLKTVVEFAEKALNILGVEYEKSFVKGLTVTLKSKLGIIDCVSPGRLLKRNADVVFVDEAAGLPVPLLFRILRNFRKIVYSSTIHGYEGSGRGFRVRFLKALKQEPKISLYEFEMETPIRYGVGDPIEKWLYDTLLLDAEPVWLSQEEIVKAKPEESLYEKPNLDEWFTSKEDELRDFIGIYVLAHYRNRPDDLAILGDAPHHHARTLKLLNNKIVVSLHLAEEGLVPDDEIEAVIKGANPPGNIIPNCIARYYQPYKHFAKLKGLRIVRIATHPDLENRGFGSYALQKLCSEAELEGYDWVGSGFGVTHQLLNFWVKNGFIPIYMSPARNIVSGEYSVFVVKPLTEKAWKLSENLNLEFRLRLIESLFDTYFDLEPKIAQLLLRGLPKPYKPTIEFSQPQLSRIKAYTEGLITYEAASDTIRNLVKLHFLSSGYVRVKLKPEIESALIAKSLQGKSWERAAILSNLSTSTIKSTIRETVKEMFRQYGEKEAFKLL